jgi:small subunit ribosomal protein S6
MVRKYESVVVMHPDLGEAGSKELGEKIRSILESGGAQISNVEEWGQRELAYRIEKETRGIYLFLEYESEHAAVVELERQLRLNDRVLRFLSVRKSTRRVPPPRKPREGDTDEFGGDSLES